MQADVSVEYQLLKFVLSGYLFKVFLALFDTIPVYIAVYYLKQFLKIEDELSF